jgi:riboflavin synthase
MFIGVIQEIGKIIQKQIENNKIYLTIKAKELINELDVGNEVSINGIAAIVNEVTGNSFKVIMDLSIMINNNIDNLEVDSAVNLEKEIQPYRYEGSHVITGNINNIGEVISINKVDGKRQLHLKTVKDLHDYFNENNSIAINGISLNISSLIEDEIEVEIIDSIWENTNLKLLQKGDQVNIETDIVGRYLGQIIEKENEISEKKQIIKKDLLKDDGFI